MRNNYYSAIIYQSCSFIFLNNPQLFFPIPQRKIAVIKAEYSDGSAFPFTDEEIIEAIVSGVNSASAYYEETTFSQINIDPTVDIYGTYQTGVAMEGGCSLIRAAAREMAIQDGYDFDYYDHEIIVAPFSLDCEFVGSAGLCVGDITGPVMLNGSINSGVISHEIGHNLCMNHARRLYCYDEH